MYCPSCRTELVVTGQERLETLDEHISGCRTIPLKDKYECPNDKCPTFGKLCWNDDGDCYGTLGNHDIQFIDNNDGAFGSIARRLNVEINKKDENFDLLKIGRFWFRLVYSYKSNDDGEILNRHRRIETWIKNRECGGYVLYLSGIRMFFFKIGSFHYARNNAWRIDKLDEFTDKNSWRNKREWWRIASCWYARTYTKLFPEKREAQHV